MDEKRFWDIIAAACRPGKSDGEWREALYALLIQLTPREIGNYACWVEAKSAALDTMDLEGAAWLIHGEFGFRHKDFVYFQHWLIGCGKKVYEAAVANPDNLVDFVTVDEYYGAEIFSVAAEAWCEATGWPETMPPDDSWMVAPPDCSPLHRNSSPEGKCWDFDDDAALRKRLPRLAAMYLSDEE